VHYLDRNHSAILILWDGDVVFFPANSKGIWEIRETTRKSYLTYKAG